jgi:CRISPR-associated protein Csd1
VILETLNDLYGRLEREPEYEIATPGHSLQKITFKVLLEPDGRLVDIQDARLPTDGGRRPRQIMVLGSAKSSGSGLNPCFLWDNSRYMLGFKVADEDPERTNLCFGAFRARHLELRDRIPSRGFSAVCSFLEAWQPARGSTFPALVDAAATGFGVFQIAGETAFVHDDPAVVSWWNRSTTSQEQPIEGQCLVTGERAPLARLHEKIKGVAGGQGSGGSLVGFNDPAFESFGKEQSFNAPVSEQVAFRYGASLNALLDGPMSAKHRIAVGGTTIAFWTDKPTVTEDVFALFATDGSAALNAPAAQDEGLRKKLDVFLRALREGRPTYTEVDARTESTNYFLLGLSPNSGRVSVRFFHRGSIDELLENLRRHHRDIGLVPQPPSGKRPGDPEFPPIWMLLRQSARESKDVSPALAAPMLNSVLTGAPYPQALFASVLRRIAADRVVNYLRSAVLKGYLNRNLNEEVAMSLDRSRTDPAYRLGRLFATLEKTQKDALGEKLNTTIRDSYYGSASTTPSTVFPRLLRLYQHHLGKLQGGARVNREKLIQELFDPMVGFPTHLGLADQGLFAIGYYHQTRDFYTKHVADPGDPAASESEA